MSKLEVIGAGFARTGTSSLREALRQLGFDPYHMAEAAARNDWDCWLRADAGDASALEEIFADFTASTDTPACMFVEELLAINPRAKVVLSVRDAAGWVRSVRATIHHPHGFERGWLFGITTFGRTFQKVAVMYKRRFYGMPLPDTDRDDAAMARAFEAHTKRIESLVPADRLLVHRATDGWAPLCAFLGKPVPDCPYPRINDTAEFQRPIRVVQAATVVLAAAGAAGALRLAAYMFQG